MVRSLLPAPRPVLLKVLTLSIFLLPEILYPHLDGSSGMRIGELGRDGTVTSFPSPAWNNWAPGRSTENRFVRTNSMRIGPDGLLWVVDTGTPKFGGKIIHGGVKLVSIDLKRNVVARIYSLDSFTHEDSFVDDVRFNGHYAFLTDAGSPALTGPMYRIETRYLEDPHLSKKALAEKVSYWANTPSTGGTAIDASGTIYLSDVEKRRIVAISPTGQTKVVLEDMRLDWPDAMWIDGEGYLWMPVAQLDKIAPFQGGKSQVVYPIRIYKMRVGEQ